MDENTHNLMLKKKKMNIGWNKCPAFNYINVKRYFKYWGYYHIVKNYIRNHYISVRCHKYTEDHVATKCTEQKKDA
jgi:hypothetical protein